MNNLSRSVSQRCCSFKLARRSMCCSLYWLIACLLLSSCAAQSGRSSQDIQIRRDVVAVEDDPAELKNNASADYNTRIATLLVGTLSQLPGFEPLSFTVQVTPPTTVFGEAIIEAMRQAGYGLQRVAEDQGRNYVSYARTEITSDLGFIVEYSLAVADVVIFRKFSIDEERISPASALTIAGAEPQFIHLFHDSFAPPEGGGLFAGNVLFELENGSQVAFAAEASNAQSPGTRRRSVTSLIEMNNAEIINLNDYAAVQEVVVEFPTADSKFLGKGNKQIIREIVQGYTPALDVFTLEGCVRDDNWDTSSTSPGQTLLWQKRVKHELMSTGIAKKNIRVSACSGQSRQESLPERAVVVTLRRLKTASN